MLTNPMHTNYFGSSGLTHWKISSVIREVEYASLCNNSSPDDCSCLKFFWRMPRCTESFCIGQKNVCWTGNVSLKYKVCFIILQLSRRNARSSNVMRSECRSFEHSHDTHPSFPVQSPTNDSKVTDCSLWLTAKKWPQRAKNHSAVHKRHDVFYWTVSDFYKRFLLAMYS